MGTIGQGLVLIPALFERMRIRGRVGEFLAIRIDLVNQSADLLPITEGLVVERNVSFSVLESVPELPPAPIVSDHPSG